MNDIKITCMCRNRKPVEFFTELPTGENAD